MEEVRDGRHQGIAATRSSAASIAGAAAIAGRAHLFDPRERNPLAVRGADERGRFFLFWELGKKRRAGG